MKLDINNLPKMFDRAAKCHQTGDLLEARRLYRSILRAIPDQFETLHSLGLLEAQRGRHKEALHFIKQALNVNSQSAEANSNPGCVYLEINRAEEALACFDKALVISPAYLDAIFNRGNALRELGRHEAALVSYDEALSIDPQHFSALVNKSNLLRDLDRYEKALVSLERAHEIQPDAPGVFVNLGIIQRKLSRYEDALLSYSKALAINPDYADALYGLGNVLQDLGRHEAALTSYDKALAIKPAYAGALSSRGVSLQYLNRHDEAVASFKAALVVDPNYVEAHWNLSLIRLNAGQFREGWEEYEWRWRHYKAEARRYDFAPWNGDASQPRRLLLWAEQGIGDEIIYASMLADLVSSPLSITLEAEPRIVSLFQRSFPQVTVVPRQNPPGLDPADFDCQTPFAGLGRWLRPSFESFPRHAGYLQPDPSRVAAYRSRLRERAPRATRVIGISWKSLNADFGSFKTMKLTDWAGILRQPNVRCVDLQYGDTAGERGLLAAQTGMYLEHLPELDLFNDLEGLTALCAACDLVITGSNVTAHVAGALGRPVWLLTPQAKGRIWYWFSGRSDSPWYPSLRLFTQQKPGSWQEVLAEVARELAAFIQT